MKGNNLIKLRFFLHNVIRSFGHRQSQLMGKKRKFLPDMKMNYLQNHSINDHSIPLSHIHNSRCISLQVKRRIYKNPLSPKYTTQLQLGAVLNPCH